MFFFSLHFRSTENLLHRLFVCIAGVADQLQTNFASDLRQILRSVFLMNVSPPIEEIEIDIGGKSKDSTSDLFEFRASENDVIHENDGGSNQSIYSAEEANPETDSVFEHATVQSIPAGGMEHQERSASLETEIRITHRNNVERSQSLGDETNTRPVSLVVTTTNQIQCLERNGNRGEYNDSPIDNNPQSTARVTANVNNNNNNPNVNNNQSPRSVDNSSTLATTTTTIILTTNSRVNRNSQNDQQSQPQQQITETPPRWIPDEEAAQCTYTKWIIYYQSVSISKYKINGFPNILFILFFSIHLWCLGMSCSQTFTTFRRRHHCRCCGGVFCGICSNSQAPLPKFGLNKAVRVCRNCFSMNITASAHT